jgi:phosphoribosylaminoimidazole-succinocarboxamide synthase
VYYSVSLVATRKTRLSHTVRNGCRPAVQIATIGFLSTMHQTPLLETNLPGIHRLGRGKVRDIYEVEGMLLLVTTDRLSAFDVVLPTGIPRKGEVLTQISLFWFDFLSDIPNHLITADVDEYPAALQPFRDQLKGRSMLCKKLEMFPVECVARGYLEGSGWKDYQTNGSVCGVELPDGLRRCGKLPQAIYTPATKAETGHDENIAFEQSVEIIGQENAERLRDLTLDIYDRAHARGLGCGVVIADTKLEFGKLDGEIVLGDEVLTPDSSRYWPLETYHPGRAQESFDKQYIREYLETLDWGKTYPGPALPDDVVANTTKKYVEAYAVITGKDLDE